MDYQMREDVVAQERHRLAVVRRIATDPRFDDDARERAAMYAVTIQSYINAVILLTEKQAIFEDAMQWDNPAHCEDARAYMAN